MHRASHRAVRPRLSADPSDRPERVQSHAEQHRYLSGVRAKTGRYRLQPQGSPSGEAGGSGRRRPDGARVRCARARPEELSGSTITITSLGPLGGIATTPVINHPEVAIVGPNKIVERPVFDGDDIRRAKLMNLSISCDHRVVDGWDAASFVQARRKLLETPVLLLAD